MQQKFQGLYYYKQGFALFSSGGLFSYPAPIGVFGICLWTVFFAMSFLLLAIHFFYRYLSITKQGFFSIMIPILIINYSAKYMYLFTLKYAWVWAIVVALGSLDYALTAWFTMYPTETVLHFVISLQKQYSRRTIFSMTLYKRTSIFQREIWDLSRLFIGFCDIHRSLSKIPQFLDLKQRHDTNQLSKLVRNYKHIHPRGNRFHQIKKKKNENDKFI